MKLYHKLIIAGTKLFEAKSGTRRCFDRWVNDVSEWLRSNGATPNLIFEWFSLNAGIEVTVEKMLDDPHVLKRYLDNVSEHFLWLAKFPTGVLSSENIDVQC